MPITHVCSVVAHDDAASFRLLAESVRRVLPEAQVVALALPGALVHLQALEGIDVLRPAALRDAELDEAVDVQPLGPVTALARPLLVAHLLEEQDAAGVLLVAPDAVLCTPPSEIADALDAGAAAVVVPRVERLPDDGERPDAQDLLEAGELDDELVAVAPAGIEVARWWAQRAVEDMTAPRIAAPGRRTPLRTAAPSPLAAATRSFAGVHELRHPGYGVSHWNLHERELARDGDGALTADGQPVRVMSFAGFRADRPWWLAEHTSRVRVLDRPALAALCRERAAALRQHGWTPRVLGDDDVHELANGLRMDARVRRLHAHAIDRGERFGDLSDPRAADELLQWMLEPVRQGPGLAVNRYALDVYDARPDLRDAYPDIEGADAEGFIGWLWVHGRAEMGLDQRLLPPAPDWVADVEPPAPAVLVIGYLRGQLGLGQAGRGYARALQAAAVPVATRAVPVDAPGTEEVHRRLDRVEHDEVVLADGREPEVVLAAVNAPQLPELVELVGRDVFDGRYVVGQWGWEVDVIPPWWETGFDLVDEIWVYSNYVAERMALVSPKPVVVVPLPVTAPVPDDVADAPGVALPDAPYTFLFAFDFLSTLQRKNPLGLIEAFERAFAPGEGPVLVLKTINARLRPEEHNRLRYAIGDREDIVVVDAALDGPQLAALFARADCYVSLHRAEGFGLTLAESMAIGKPVVATRFGGNTDFMTPFNSYLVDYELTRVGPDAEHYPADATWAEPSVEHAAAVLREVWEDQDAAAARGERARRDIAALLSPEAVGAIARERLNRIGPRRDVSTGDEQPWPLDELDRLLGMDREAATAGGVRGRAQELALRAVRPYIRREATLDETLVAAVRRLALALEAVEQGRARDRARLGRMERELRDLRR